MNSEQFTQQVLGALQLNPCEQAQMLLDEYAGGTLAALHQDLTRQHLETCPDCHALLGAMLTLNSQLPALQSLRVPESFTAIVMNRTVHQVIAQPRMQRPGRLPSWLMRPRFALESAYAMTVVVMLFSGLTDVNAFDTFDRTLWERARPRLPESTLALEQVSTQIAEHVTEQVEQQSEKIESAYDDTTQAIHTWTQEKYAAFTERFAELTR